MVFVFGVLTVNAKPLANRYSDCNNWAQMQARFYDLSYEEEYYEFRSCFDDDYSFWNEPCN